MEKHLEARLHDLQASRGALQELYQALTPEQKLVLDRMTAWREHGSRRG
jgi:hypothetical protein